MIDILVTGGTGMVGKAIQKLVSKNKNIIFVGSKDFDLTDFAATTKMMQIYKPKKIIHLAAKVGGVKANSENLVDFYNKNILINTNVLMAADLNDVQHIVSLLSTCVYPDENWVTYPLTENQLHNGPPHKSNYAYAFSKRMLEVQSRAYKQQKGRNYCTAIPNNIFGPHDFFDLENGHVVPSVIRKIYEAKSNETDATFWGDGSALREFTFSEDIAAVLLKMIGYQTNKNYNSIEPCNIGSNKEYSIKDLVEIIADIFEYKGNVIWDKTKPAGQLRKPSLATKIPYTYKSLYEGLEITCEWFEENYPNVRGVKQL